MLEQKSDTERVHEMMGEVHADIAESETVRYDEPEAPAKPKRTRAKNGSKPAEKSKTGQILLVLKADGTWREFDEDDMLAEAAGAFGYADVRIVRGQVLDFEIKEK